MSSLWTHINSIHQENAVRQLPFPGTQVEGPVMYPARCRVLLSVRVTPRYDLGYILGVLQSRRAFHSDKGGAGCGKIQ
jgi:hypothetical protein